MKICLFIALFLISFCASAQTNSDTTGLDLSVSLTTYTFAYKTMLEEGSTVAGPTMFLKDQNLSIQIGALYDFKKYNYSYGGHFDPYTVKYSYLYFPLLFHYKYWSGNKFSSFLLAGVFLKAPITFDKNISVNKGITINAGAGIGLSYKFTNRFSMNLYPSVRYGQNELFPGLTADLLVSLKKSKK